MNESAKAEFPSWSKLGLITRNIANGEDWRIKEREREREIPIGGKNKGDRTVGLLLRGWKNAEPVQLQRLCPG